MKVAYFVLFTLALFGTLASASFFKNLVPNKKPKDTGETKEPILNEKPQTNTSSSTTLTNKQSKQQRNNESISDNFRSQSNSWFDELSKVDTRMKSLLNGADADQSLIANIIEYDGKLFREMELGIQSKYYPVEYKPYREGRQVKNADAIIFENKMNVTLEMYTRRLRKIVYTLDTKITHERKQKLMILLLETLYVVHPVLKILDADGIRMYCVNNDYIVTALQKIMNQKDDYSKDCNEEIKEIMKILARYTGIQLSPKNQREVIIHTLTEGLTRNDNLLLMDAVREYANVMGNLEKHVSDKLTIEDKEDYCSYIAWLRQHFSGFNSMRETGNTSLYIEWLLTRMDQIVGVLLTSDDKTKTDKMLFFLDEVLPMLNRLLTEDPKLRLFLKYQYTFASLELVIKEYTLMHNKALLNISHLYNTMLEENLVVIMEGTSSVNNWQLTNFHQGLAQLCIIATHLPLNKLKELMLSHKASLEKALRYKDILIDPRHKPHKYLAAMFLTVEIIYKQVFKEMAHDTSRPSENTDKITITEFLPDVAYDAINIVSVKEGFTFVSDRIMAPQLIPEISESSPRSWTFKVNTQLMLKKLEEELLGKLSLQIVVHNFLNDWNNHMPFERKQDIIIERTFKGTNKYSVVDYISYLESTIINESKVLKFADNGWDLLNFAGRLFERIGRIISAMDHDTSEDQIYLKYLLADAARPLACVVQQLDEHYTRLCAINYFYTIKSLRNIAKNANNYSEQCVKDLYAIKIKFSSSTEDNADVLNENNIVVVKETYMGQLYSQHDKTLQLTMNDFIEARNNAALAEFIREENRFVVIYSEWLNTMFTGPHTDTAKGDVLVRILDALLTRADRILGLLQAGKQSDRNLQLLLDEALRLVSIVMTNNENNLLLLHAILNHQYTFAFLRGLKDLADYNKTDINKIVSIEEKLVKRYLDLDKNYLPRSNLFSGKLIQYLIVASKLTIGALREHTVKSNINPNDIINEMQGDDSPLHSKDLLPAIISVFHIIYGTDGKSRILHGVEDMDSSGNFQISIDPSP